jgi:hypothetical protein
MKKLLRNVLLIVILVLLVVGIVAVFKPEVFKITTNKTSETSLLQDKLVEMSDWTTLKYEYSTVIVSRTEKSLSILGITEIEYAKAIKLIEYSGYLKAGTDISKIQLSYDEKTKELFVKVPKSKILDNVVDTDRTTVEDVKGNIFSDYPTQVIFNEINANKKELEKEKISQGFLEEADKRIQLLLASFLGTNGYDDVVIELY